MQKYVKSNTDTRTFTEVWQTLTAAERGLLKENLIETLCCTRQSVDNWGKGMSPINRGFREKVAKVINKTFNYKTHYITLFPNAR